jgi:hypothetical protein
MSLRIVDFSTPLEMTIGTTSFKIPTKKLDVCVLFIIQIRGLVNLMQSPTNMCLLGILVERRGISVMIQ